MVTMKIIIIQKFALDLTAVKKGKRKVQGVPQSQAAAHPRHERGRGNRQNQTSAKKPYFYSQTAKVCKVFSASYDLIRYLLRSVILSKFLY